MAQMAFAPILAATEGMDEALRQKIHDTVMIAVNLRATGNMDGFSAVWDVLNKFVGPELAREAIMAGLENWNAASQEADDRFAVLQAQHERGLKAAKRQGFYSDPLDIRYT